MHLTYIYNHLLQHPKNVRIITFSSYYSHTNILFYHLNVLPFKKQIFLRIGPNVKYEDGELPDALNMFFFVTNRYVHNYNTRNKAILCPAIAKHPYRDFQLVGVHVWNYICDNIKIGTSFSSFKKILKNVLYHKFLCLCFI